MAKANKQSEGVLADTARSIGSALGKISAQAEELTAKAKKIHMPTKAEAKKFVTGLLPSKKKVAAKKKVVVKKVATVKAAVKKAAAKPVVKKKTAKKK